MRVLTSVTIVLTLVVISACSFDEKKIDEITSASEKINLGESINDLKNSMMNTFTLTSDEKKDLEKKVYNEVSNILNIPEVISNNVLPNEKKVPDIFNNTTKVIVINNDLKLKKYFENIKVLEDSSEIFKRCINENLYAVSNCEEIKNNTLKIFSSILK